MFLQWQAFRRKKKISQQRSYILYFQIRFLLVCYLIYVSRSSKDAKCCDWPSHLSIVDPMMLTGDINLTCVSCISKDAANATFHTIPHRFHATGVISMRKACHVCLVLSFKICCRQKRNRNVAHRVENIWFWPMTSYWISIWYFFMWGGKNVNARCLALDKLPRFNFHTNLRMQKRQNPYHNDYQKMFCLKRTDRYFDTFIYFSMFRHCFKCFYNICSMFFDVFNVCLMFN